MPSMVGGFGNNNKILKLNMSTSSESNDNSNKNTKFILDSPIFRSYLAGLIEGDGTFAVHNKESTNKRYSPMIIVCFKLADMPLANFLQNLTQCGKVYEKKGRGYILWQISKLTEVYIIVNLINGYLRTPKIEALGRTIEWINLYKDRNINSKLPSTINILNVIGTSQLVLKELNTSPLNNDAWLSGFTDADGNFSINITTRKKGNYRVQLFFRLEVAQMYTNNNSNISLFNIVSQISLLFNVNVLTRTRLFKGKEYTSFIIMAASKNSLNKVIEYFDKYPLLSSKYLDYLDFCKVKNLQDSKKLTSSYIATAQKIRENFNKTRSTFTWNHLKF